MLRLYGLYPETLPAPALLLRKDYAAFQQCEQEKQSVSRPVIEDGISFSQR
jgi:hypothetical protein